LITILRRRILLHVSETFLPSSLFVALSWLSFLIPPEVVPGRMALLVTLLLVLVNIFLRVSASVPASTRITAMGLWIIGGIMSVALALAEYGVILYVNRNRSFDLKRLERRVTAATRVTPTYWSSFVARAGIFPARSGRSCKTTIAAVWN